MDVVTLGAALKGSKTYTDQVAQSLMGGVRYQGEVDYYSDLPSNPEEGDAYTVKYSGTSGTDLDGTEYTWGLNHQTQQYGWIDFSKDSYTKTETNALLNGKQNALVVGTNLDSTPTDGSNNPVTSDGVYDALTGKQDTIDNSHKLSADLVDDSSSTNKFVTGTTGFVVGTNYIETPSGQRLYISSTAPTGTIPEGALGIGF